MATNETDEVIRQGDEEVRLSYSYSQWIMSEIVSEVVWVLGGDFLGGTVLGFSF